MNANTTRPFTRHGADGDEEIVLVRGYRALRNVLNDWRTFSSDTHGMLVLTPQDKTRTFKQYPFELDPPEHTALRSVVEPFFRRPLEPEYAEKLEGIVARAVADLISRVNVDVTDDFSLPLQSRALSVLLGMPESEAEIWERWGVNVFFSDPHSAVIDDEKANTLVQYVEEMTDKAESLPSESLFAVLARAEVDGRSLTRDERLGFAHIAFSGGRDTVISMITGIVALFAQHPEAMSGIRNNPDLAKSAAEELIRLVSPLRVLMRVCPAGGEIDGVPVREGQRVALCYGRASHDDSKFDRPDAFEIDRSPNPHLAFGAGPHTCLGNAHARLLARLLMVELSRQLASIEIVEAVPEDESSEFNVSGLRFQRLVVRARSAPQH